MASLDLVAAIQELAGFNDDPDAGGITREVYTPTYERAIRWVERLMQDAGLVTRFDAAGNLFGRWEAGDGPHVLTGSHVDTTLNAGAYDGVLGVLGAIAAIHTLRDAGFAPARSIELIAFAGEEPRFGTGCVGSRVLAGALSRADLDRLIDRNGVSMASALTDAGYDPDRCADARLDPASIHAFVELHIEQAIVLETYGEEIGVVEAIAAPHDFTLVFTGAATHSGATPMNLRRDALVGASECMVELERIASSSASGTTVGTVGVIRAFPGAINVVPGTVELDVDIRDSDRTARAAVVEAIITSAQTIAARRGLSVDVRPIVEDTPVICAPLIVEAVQAAADAVEATSRRMISGAYHDAMILGSAGIPVGMLFVPSRAGISHHPDEFTEPAQLERGVAVLAGVLERLAG